ncbi:MAG: hypothetical protein K2X87_15635, partial [Gemmataceae bacterium]|nr:hypothetical protein [Gemmataceae bacterium]
MPATTVAKPAADSAPLWAAVDEHLDAFAAAWGSAGEPPAVGRFAPPGPPEVRRLVLAELVKMDLEYRLGRGLDRPLDDYLREFPDLAAGGPPTDLLFEDFHLRRRAGRDPDPADYSRRFPDR